ncbi:MAG: sulfotransferase domain-containing protein [Chlamydiae bacterium]|nr:sulfotransferase domain-containing protein [Chlamydiota bacterium]
MTTPRSGSNLFYACLYAITGRPISWLEWGESVFYPDSEKTKHPSYNRLGLPLVDQRPLLYRTHFSLNELRQVSSLCNRLIFLMRNPKELLFRAHRLAHPNQKEPDTLFIQKFLDECLAPFKVYESWNPVNRMLIYYEDLIIDENKVFLEALDFMRVDPTFFEEFIRNKEEYMKCLLESYSKQHVRKRGGESSVGGVKEIFYSQDVNPEILKGIDRYLMQREPNLWNLYLKRFES